MNTIGPQKEGKQSTLSNCVWKLHSQCTKTPTKPTGSVINYIVIKVQPEHKCY